MAKDYYYLRKTIDYFKEKGYEVEKLEKTYRVYDEEKDSVIFVKRDIFSSDLLAMNENEVIFIQLKTNKSDISKGIKAYKRMKRPVGRWNIKFWVVSWEKRKKDPIIVDVDEVIEKSERKNGR